MKTILIDFDGTLYDLNNNNLNNYNSEMKIKFDKEQDMAIENGVLETARKSYKPLTISRMYEKSKEVQEFYSQDKFNGEGFYKNGKLFEGAIKFLEILNKNGFNVVILSSSISGTGQKDNKEKFILNNIPQDLLGSVTIDGNNKKINGTYEKMILSNTKKFNFSEDCVLLDDKISTIASHTTQNFSTGILINHNKNIDDIKNEISNLIEVKVKRGERYSDETLKKMSKENITMSNFSICSGFNDVLKSLNISERLNIKIKTEQKQLNLNN